MLPRLTLVLGSAMAVLWAVSDQVVNAEDSPITAFDHQFVSIDDTPMPLAKYERKVLLIVNTASFCGFTDQYQGLQSLWETYRDRGLVVIGVPSNDFGWQEPGTNEEIKTFCQGAFGITFPLTEKYKVKGRNAHAFYKWARKSHGLTNVPMWNFHKYLVGRDGQILASFSAMTKPRSPRVIKAIEDALASGTSDSGALSMPPRQQPLLPGRSATLHASGRTRE